MARYAYEALLSELEHWDSAGQSARFWWRDDDAERDTPALRRLLRLADDFAVSIGLAVIPDAADASLVEAAQGSSCIVWQHGKSHARGEFAEPRPLLAMADDARKGQEQLDRAFGPFGWQRVFVPPFHELALPFKAQLAALGYDGLSTGEPLTPPVGNLREVNADLDLIGWQDRKFIGKEAAEAAIAAALRSRRTGRRQQDRPIGLLTHHLAMEEDVWEFIEELLAILKAHPAAGLVPAPDLFPRPVPAAYAAKPDANGPAVSVVLTSCGRWDLLEKTLRSFFSLNTFAIADFLVVEDSGQPVPALLRDRFAERGIRWLDTGGRLGQIAAIDLAYHELATEYVFHCEDDWEFYAPGFIERSLVVLTANPEVLQVWIRSFEDTNGHPICRPVLSAHGVPFRLMHPDHVNDTGTWHGFSFNPGLRRRDDYELVGAYSAFDPEGNKRSFEVELAAGEFYRSRGFVAAILAECGGAGYVKHIGAGRHVPEPGGR